MTVHDQSAWHVRRPEQESPFDIIGDVHGCCHELERLLKQLGYVLQERRPGNGLSDGPVFMHPQGRIAVFLGGLVDRGPCILETLRLVHNMVIAGSGLSVIGNHDDKLLRKLKGHNVKIKHGLDITMAELEALPHEDRRHLGKALKAFLESLPYYLVLDHGRLVVAHAGLIEELQGKHNNRVKEFALYGAPTGEKDEYGLPVREDWAKSYSGDALVVYGHTPVAEPYWRNNTVDIDTGCIFGGYLTALRYPEREVVSVAADKVYYQSSKPFPVAAPLQGS